MNAELAPRTVKVVLVTVQLVVGAVSGWFASGAALLCLNVMFRVVGIPPKVGDLIGMGAMVLWATLWTFGAAVSYNHRPRWLALILGFTVGAAVFAFFAVTVLIPFGASMRDFDSHPVDSTT